MASGHLLIVVQAVGDTPTLPARTPQTMWVGNGNSLNGERWQNGTSSGQINTIYEAALTIGASATSSLNTLAAGGLTDIDGNTVDLDEGKALVVYVVSGAVTVKGGATNPWSCFTAAGEGVALSAGQCVGISLGAAGIDVTTNSKIDITDTAGGSGSSVYVAILGAS